MSDDEFVHVYVVSVGHFGGSVVVIEGQDEEGDTVVFACDHHYAVDIAEALERGEGPEVYLEEWQILSWARP